MAVIDQSRWGYVVTDMSGNRPTGAGQILNAGQKTFSYHLNSGRTAQITINIDNPRANFILGNDCLLKVYRKTRFTNQWQFMMVGDIIQADESGQGDMGLLTVVAADPWWRLQRRLIGMGTDSAGRGTGYSDGTPSAMVDNSVLLQHILTNINGIFPTGIQLGTVLAAGTNGYIGPVYAQNVGDIFQQICNTLGGPNFEIVPVEPSGTMPNTIIAQMNIQSAIGSTRTNTIFEYGTGKHNVATYDRILSKDGLANLVYSPPQGWPDMVAAGDGMIFAQDTATENSTGLYQDIIQGDLVSRQLRQVLVNETLAVRKQARQQITFTPTVDCPLDFGVDYQVGDIVGARAYVSGGYRYNGTARIYGVDIAVDDNDAETPALTLIPGG